MCQSRIRMKKKIIFAIATGFFAVATVFNMNILQSNSADDVSLEAIAIMAQATKTEVDKKCADSRTDVIEHAVTDEDGNVLYTRKVTICESWGVGNVTCC